MRAIALALLLLAGLAGGPVLAQDADGQVVSPDPLDLPQSQVGFCRACELQNCECDAERGMCVDCGDLDVSEGVIDDVSREATTNACLQLGGELVGERCRY
jgi:hypothetical protein